MRGQCPTLRLSLVLDDDWDRLRAAAAPVSDADLQQREATLQFDDPINIQYTSGTTGFPKGATLSHHNILNNGYFVGELCRYTEPTGSASPCPSIIASGWCMGNLACTTPRRRMVVPAIASIPGRRCKLSQAERCTSLYGVPTMFIAELDHPRFAEFDLSARCAPGSWPARPVRWR